MSTELVQYGQLLTEVKTRIRQAQTRAVLSANREMLLLYWDIGRLIVQRLQEEDWGSAVIKRLSQDVGNEIPDVKGFSESNLKRMCRFYREYPFLSLSEPRPVDQLPRPVGAQAVRQITEPIGAQPVRQLQAIASEEVESVREAVLGLPWGHNILLFQKFKDLSTRLWYIRAAIEQGWSRNILQLMIDSRAHERQGQAVTNFEQRLPPPQSDLATQALRDPYLFDFLTLEEPFHERELETGLVRHLQNFLLELGQGFSFVGRQYHLEVGGEDFYIDLLFYHLRLRSFVVIDLKKGPFKPDYAGKMNFYCSVVDDRLKHETDQQTIGLILCQHKNKVVAEYALRGLNKPIGISEYELTRALPPDLKSALPTIEEIEQELGGEGLTDGESI